MTSLFDAGDYQRIDREKNLTRQRERVPVERPENEPDGEFDDNEVEEDVFDTMAKRFIAALKRQLGDKHGLE